MLKYIIMKRIFFLAAALFYAACSPQGRAALVRSYNLHPFSLITPEELVQRIRSNPQYYIIVDTRTKEEYEAGHIAGAIHYPKTAMSKPSDFPSGPLAHTDGKPPLLIYNGDGRFYGNIRRFLEPKVLQPMFFLEFGFSQWVGPMEGTDTAQMLETNQQRSDAYNL